MELKSFQTETHIKASMKKGSSMVKEPMYGHLDQVMKAHLSLVRSTEKESGSPKLENCILETIFKTKSMDLEDINGKMDVSMKVNSAMIESNPVII
jgi:hypothetical protein